MKKNLFHATNKINWTPLTNQITYKEVNSFRRCSKVQIMQISNNKCTGKLHKFRQLAKSPSKSQRIKKQHQTSSNCCHRR